MFASERQEFSGIQENSGEFRHPPQRSELVIKCCLWYLNVADGQLERKISSGDVFTAD